MNILTKSKLVLLFLIFTIIYAEKETATKEKNGDIVGFPFFCYAPETGIAGGGRLAYFWKDGSNVYTNIFLSQKLQIELFFGGDINKKEYRIVPKFKISYWTDYYYGKGSVIEKVGQIYDERFTWGYLSVQKKKNLFYYGFDVDGRYEKSDIIGADIIGSGLWYVFGIGTKESYDTRDDLNYPTNGVYIEGFYRYYVPIRNSLSFSKLSLNARYYNSVKKVIIASQLKGEYSGNCTPVQVLPSVGDVIRGYNQTYYKDNLLISSQIEARMPIWRKFSGTIFVGLGDVFGVNGFKIDNIKIAGGLGIRYQLTSSKVNLRLDYAINKNLENSFYIDIGESF